MRENFELNKEKVQTVQINHTFLAIKIGCFKLRRTIQHLILVTISVWSKNEYFRGQNINFIHQI